MEDGEIVEAVAMEEMHSKNGRSPFVVLEETKLAVKEIVDEILSMKANRYASKTSLSDLVTEMCLHFVSLRQANRSILVEEDRVKAETERSKAPVDFTTLQFHNLMYEKSHYLKGIKACKDFKSKYPDIELVSENEFLRDAPEDIKSVTLSDDSSHNLMLQRLNYELYQRKELCKRKEELEKKKKSLLETITNRKKFLSSLPSHLKALKKASLPVQNYLGISHSKKLKQQSMAELLPPPLYVLFSQLLVQKEAFGESIDLDIVGNMKDALSFARQLATKDADLAANKENTLLEDDVCDEDDDGQRRRKRSKKALIKENLDGEEDYITHPLKVILYVYDEGALDATSERLTALQFEYLVKLNVVCAGVEGSNDGSKNSILCNLFPDDTGIELPHQFIKFSVGVATNFDETRPARPYKWVQHLAGIDFLPEVAPLLNSHDISSNVGGKHSVISGLSLYRQQNRVQTVVQRIRSRKKAQLALAEQFDSLAILKWPSRDCVNLPWTLHTISCYLEGWSQVTPSTNHTLLIPASDADQMQSLVDLNQDVATDGSKEGQHENEEDGELVSSNSKSLPKFSGVDKSKQMNLFSKSILSISPSFKKHDDESEMLLDVDADSDEHEQVNSDDDNSDVAAYYNMMKATWSSYGAKEYILVFSKKLEAGNKHVKLEAKVSISMEYPVRPPLFSLTVCRRRNNDGYDSCPEWFNDLRAMEAEVNVHILKLIPKEEDNYVLSHQIRCLAMLFDYLSEEGTASAADGSRTFRGRDRRRMILRMHEKS